MDQINVNEIKTHFKYKNYAAYGSEILNLSKIKF